MAQGKSNLIWYIIGGVVIIGGGVGAYLFFKNRKAKKEAEQAATNEQGAAAETQSGATTSTASTSGGGTSLPSTPFKNNDEGNLFRGWINKTYPTYAKEIDLDPSSTSSNGYNNTNIRKAFAKYGTEYFQSGAASSKPVTTSALGIIKEQMPNPNIWGNNIKLTSSTNNEAKYSLDVDGAYDAKLNFKNNGDFSITWLTTAILSTFGTWSYANNTFSITLKDGSFTAQDGNIAKVVKQVLKAKYPDKMKYFSFQGPKSVDAMLNMSGKSFVDAQDSLL